MQFIVNYDSQKFSVINFLDTGDIYMDGRTTFSFTLGSEYHEICFIDIQGYSIDIQPFYHLTQFIVHNIG